MEPINFEDYALPMEIIDQKNELLLRREEILKKIHGMEQDRTSLYVNAINDNKNKENYNINLLVIQSLLQKIKKLSKNGLHARIGSLSTLILYFSSILIGVLTQSIPISGIGFGMCAIVTILREKIKFPIILDNKILFINAKESAKEKEQLERQLAFFRSVVDEMDLTIELQIDEYYRNSTIILPLLNASLDKIEKLEEKLKTLPWYDEICEWHKLRKQTDKKQSDINSDNRADILKTEIEIATLSTDTTFIPGIKRNRKRVQDDNWLTGNN